MAWADGFFFYPTTRTYDHPENYGLRWADVFIPAPSGGPLHGWFFPVARARGTVVHCHGNAGNVSGHFPFAAWLTGYGWNVLCFDYRGFGRSPGRVTRRGIIEDIPAALAWARAQSGVDPRRVVLLGQSLGAAAAIVAVADLADSPAAQRPDPPAARRPDPPAALCLDGPFAGFRAEARYITRRTWYLWAASPLIARWLVSDEFAARDYVARLPAIPKLFICGTADPIVDPQQTLALHAAASPPRDLWLIEGGGHCTALLAPDPAGRQRVADFFAAAVGE